MPGETSIISAAKVTGKTENGLSVGFLQSVTDNEHANVWVNGGERRVQVAPTTNYVVGRVQKDWDKGNTYMGGMFTSTHRWLPDDAALHVLPTDAFTGAVDGAHFFNNRSYVVEGKGYFSRVSGDALAIRELQTNPVHYYQRPDADHLGVDASATSLSGWGSTARVARYGNSKWLWSEEARLCRPGSNSTMSATCGRPTRCSTRRSSSSRRPRRRGCSVRTRSTWRARTPGTSAG